MGLAGELEEEEVEVELAPEPGPGLERGFERELELVADLVLVRLLAAAAESRLTSDTAHKHRQSV